jgi:membrane-associated PAP2 superfamily phosphatase
VIGEALRAGRCALLTAALLVVVIVVQNETAFDSQVSDWIYGARGAGWPVSHTGWLRFAGYEGPKYLLGIIDLGLIAALLWAPLLSRLHLSRREAAYLLTCFAVVPLTIGTLRNHSGIACASDLLRYGGSVPDIMGNISLKLWFDPNKGRGCWPSAHAGGGFALLALGMLRRPRGTQLGLWLFGLLYGSWMGLYQMLRGAHFLSHVLVSALLAQLLVCLLSGWFSVGRYATDHSLHGSPQKRSA